MNRFDKIRVDIIQAFAKKYLAGAKILDIGCGTGERTSLFVSICHKVYGIDLKNNLKNKYQAKIIFQKANALKLPYQSSSFDAVVSFDVIEHIKDDKKMVRQIKKVCKAKGIVIIGTPNINRLSNKIRALIGKKISYPYQLGPGIVHVREYNANSLKKLFQQAGFETIDLVNVYFGLTGKINFGFKNIPNCLKKYSQYLLYVGKNSK